jgi:hypothetical protein
MPTASRKARRSQSQAANRRNSPGFIVVTDHSNGFGFFALLFEGDAKMLAYPQGRRWCDMIQSGKGGDAAI